jgi:hypothetical protein
MVAVDVVAVRSMAVIRPVRVSGLITVFAVWMIHLCGSQPPSKAILQQDFVASLLLILIGIGSRGHLGGLRRSAGSGPIGSARRQIVSPGTWGPITDLRPRSSVVRAWGCGHTRSAHLGGAAAPSASGRASGEPTQRFPNGSFADPAHCVSRAPRLLAHRMMRSPIPRTDPSPSTRLVPT